MRLPYRIVRPLARIALKVYFKKIYLTGVEYLPKDKPVILAANHPTSFLEPCLLACFLPEPLYFMVRGDFFQKPLYRKLLESLQMIPMYRLKDIGYKGVKNNFASLDIVYDLLKDHKTILILAEGTSVHEKRLRPIRKGTARMALGAIEKYASLDVHIVPIGVNYSDVLRFRSFVMLDVGPSISVRDYLKNANQHPAKTINAITKVLKNQLEQRVIHIAEKEDDALMEQIFTLFRNERIATSFPIQTTDRMPLEREIQLAKAINELPKEGKENLRDMSSQYFEQLQRLGISDYAVRTDRSNSFLDYLFLLVGFIPFLLGYVLNFLPLYFAKWWSDNKVHIIEFVAPIRASFGLGAYLIYFLFLLIIGLFIGEAWYWGFVLSVPILGGFALFFRDFALQLRERWWWSMIEKDKQAALVQERAKMCQFL